MRNLIRKPIGCESGASPALEGESSVRGSHVASLQPLRDWASQRRGHDAVLPSYRHPDGSKKFERPLCRPKGGGSQLSEPASWGCGSASDRTAHYPPTHTHT